MGNETSRQSWRSNTNAANNAADGCCVPVVSVVAATHSSKANSNEERIDAPERGDFAVEDLCIELKHYDKAVHLFSEGEKSQPKNGCLKINLSYCLYSLKRYEESYNKAKEAVDVCEQRLKAKAYFRCAEALRELNRLDEALDAFKLANKYGDNCQISRNRIDLIIQKMNVEKITNVERSRIVAHNSWANQSYSLSHSKTDKQFYASKRNEETNSQIKVNIKRESVGKANMDKEMRNPRLAYRYNYRKVDSNDGKTIKLIEDFDGSSALKVNDNPEENILRISNQINGLQSPQSATNFVNECKLFINRSYCYYKIGNYKNSLKDAQQAIKLNPQNVGAYYRASLALKGIGNFVESEEMMLKVKDLLPNCHLVEKELLEIRVQALQKMGFTNEFSLNAAQKHQTIKESYEELLLNLKSEKCETKTECPQSDSSEKPTNILQLNALMVKNLNSNVGHAVLHCMFGKFGKIKRIYLDRVHHCCYINYDNGQSPIEAISALNGFIKEGICYKESKPLILALVPSDEQRYRFRNIPKAHLITLIREYGECDDWRRRDCILEDKCPLKHIRINKGIETLLNKHVKT